MQFMPFEINTTRTFAAAHQLRLPGGGIEPLHGHNWRVRVTVSGSTLDELGTVMDFHELERLIDLIIRPMHNRHLNEVEPFVRELNPSAENVAFHIARSLALPNHVRLERVEVWETDENSAVYKPSSA